MSVSVLVIEDDDEHRGLLGRLLRREGMEPVLAGNAELGLAMMDLRRCDTAVVDVHLPGMSGLEALDAIVAKWPDFPVILATASPTVSAEEAVARGAHGFLRKPFSAGVLLGAVGAALGPEVTRPRLGPGGRSPRQAHG